MKIFEVTEVRENDSLGFDLVDDASYYMRNDPSFYRKEFYPCMSKVADKHTAGASIDKNMIMSMVERGINKYVQEYNLGRSVADVFKQPDRDALVDKLFSEEIEEIKKGDYK